MNLEELQDKSMSYDNHMYWEFIEDYMDEIEALHEDDRFMLLKRVVLIFKLQIFVI